LSDAKFYWWLVAGGWWEKEIKAFGFLVPLEVVGVGKIII